MNVSIEFAGDPSVGLFPYGFGMEIPAHFAGDSDDPDYIKYREETRADIKKLYELMDGEGHCKVWFEDELTEAWDSDIDFNIEMEKNRIAYQTAEQEEYESSLEIHSYPIYINGKAKTSMEFNSNVSQHDMEFAVLTNITVIKELEYKVPKKVIFVKNKMISVVS